MRSRSPGQGGVFRRKTNIRGDAITYDSFSFWYIDVCRTLRYGPVSSSKRSANDGLQLELEKVRRRLGNQ